MRNYFTLDGTDSRDFGVYISGRGTFNGPARNLDFISVPGRSGELIATNTRLRNATLTYPAFVVSDFRNRMAAFRAFLLESVGYRRLVDSYHPDEYRMAAYRGPLTVKATDRNDAGTFDITFDVMPQRFLLSGDTTVVFTASGSLFNPTRYPALPWMRVYGKGVVGIGPVNITIDNHNCGYMDIDCEIGRAYCGAEALDYKVTLSSTDYPRLMPGSNGVTLGSGITRVEVKPRWWTV